MNPNSLAQMPLFHDGNDPPIPPDQQRMIDRLERGETLVIDLHAESLRRLLPLLTWAKTHERFVYIGRGQRWTTEAETLFPEVKRDSPWCNPFQFPRDGTRDEVIAKYEAHLTSRPDLLARLPELQRKILGCWCHPEPCHGDVLIGQLKRNEA